MKIHSLEVENFKGFERQSFEFSDQFSLLIGNNGTGKTAILDALAVGMGTWFLGIDGSKSRPIFPHEIRQVSYQKGQTYTNEPQYPVSVTCKGTVNGEAMEWKRTLEIQNKPIDRKDAREIIKLSKQLQKQVSQGEDVLLPLIAYYGTGRLWLQKRGQSVEPAKTGSRTMGYVDCLDPASNIKLFVRWLKKMELVALQRGEGIGVLDAVKVAVTDSMEDCKKITYDFAQDQIMVSANDKTLPWRMLSDGVRNMLAMVADIAYRAAVLNPQLSEAAAKKTPGIVLIDEIDLHLHPKWQRRVVEDLRRTFPQIQFIATTHSEHIIQSLRPGELINLDPQIGEYVNQSIEDITENVMGVDLPQRSKRWQEMMAVAEEYYRVLQEAKNVHGDELEKLKIKLDELTLPFSNDPAYQAFLKMERQAALREKNEAD
ncbi:MAG: AAA family ATPase [Gomphosphaeria aponina SAG 52.96 = DSM 107014]|uniref:AAA family ATPase n=1 Tax=Gomphosphaeria aponina SAG 52.96 = DSM 107014 TaxID=1521640 RepID=A0A941GRV0_9CHRO|nr:AAA family ATPase [Gomphosphaeria aponina SAG 52.96 = DSM 107014]